MTFLTVYLLIGTLLGFMVLSEREHRVWQQWLLYPVLFALLGGFFLLFRIMANNARDIAEDLDAKE